MADLADLVQLEDMEDGEETEALGRKTRGGLLIYERDPFSCCRRAQDAKKVSRGAGFVAEDTEG